MTILTHTTDDKARITLPKTFANSTILVEQLSDTELRIRKARVIPEDELPFVEESIGPLSDRDRDIFLSLLDTPPRPNAALRQLLTSGHELQNDSRPSPDLTSLSWPAFLARVRAEQHPPGQPRLQERLQLLRAVRQLFKQEPHFLDLDYVSRRKIAGLYKSTNPNFLLFGSMQWVGLFKQAIKDNNKGISLALDEIPLDGPVARDHYQRFTELFLQAFKRSGMALASRLLAMKRPDIFVCVNNQNREGLVQAFHISPGRDPEAYWDLIEKVRTCAWWQAAPPAAGEECEVWNARAAFLDSLFYTGVGIDSDSR